MFNQSPCREANNFSEDQTAKCGMKQAICGGEFINVTECATFVDHCGPAKSLSYSIKC